MSGSDDSTSVSASSYQELTHRIERIAHLHCMEGNSEFANTCRRFLSKFETGFCREIDDREVLQSTADVALEKLLGALPFTSVAEVTRHVPVTVLYRRMSILEHLNQQSILCHTLEDLTQQLRAFIEYQQATRDNLIRTGLPECECDLAPWFDDQLSRLFPTRRTTSLVPQSEPFSTWSYEKDGSDDAGAEEAKLALTEEPFEWMRIPESGVFTPSDIQRTSYEEASLLRSMTAADANWLDGHREQFFNARLRVLELLLDCLEKRDAEQLLERAFDLIVDEIGVETTYDFLLKDQLYLDVDATSLEQLHCSKFDHPGGLVNITLVIRHAEAEIRFQRFDGFCREVPQDCRVQVFDSLDVVDSYLRLLDHELASSDGEQLSSELDRFLGKYEDVNRHRAQFCERLGQWLATRLDVNSAGSIESSRHSSSPSSLTEAATSGEVGSVTEPGDEDITRLVIRWLDRLNDQGRHGFFYLVDRLTRLENVASSVDAVSTQSRQQDDTPSMPETTDDNSYSDDSEVGASGGCHPYEFKYEGPMFRVTFRSNPVKIQPTTGLYYLRQLLAMPGTEVDPVALKNSFNLWSRVLESSRSNQALDDLASELSPQSPKAGQIIDSRAVKAYEKEVARHEQLIAEAKANGLTSQIEELQESLRAFRSELSNARNRWGELREAAGERKKAQNSIRKTINTALKNLGKVHPELHAHLLASIDRRSPYCYSPSEEVDWRL